MAARSVPLVRKFTAGEVEVGAYFNALANGLNFLLGPPIASLRQTVAQSIANADAVTALLYDTEDSDSDNGHSTVTNTDRYTFQQAATFLIFGGATFAANTTGTHRQIRWRVNGADISAGFNGIGVAAGSTNLTVLAPTKLITVNAGDYLQLCVNHDATAAVSTVINGATAQAHMGIYLASR